MMVIRKGLGNGESNGNADPWAFGMHVSGGLSCTHQYRDKSE